MKPGTVHLARMACALALTSLGVTPLAAAPLDVSREACMVRLLKPGSQVELAAMICDQQIYLSPAAMEAIRQERLRRDEQQIADEQEQEKAFQAWLLQHPGATRSQWLNERATAASQRFAAIAARVKQQRQLEAQAQRAQRAAALRWQRQQAQREWACWKRRYDLYQQGHKKAFQPNYADTTLEVSCQSAQSSLQPTPWNLLLSEFAASTQPQ